MDRKQRREWKIQERRYQRANKRAKKSILKTEKLIRIMEKATNEQSRIREAAK